MHPFSFVSLVLLAITAGASGQNQPTVLHDGQQVQLTGRLTMEPGGRLQFVTLKTAKAYVPVFKSYQGGGDEKGEAVHEIGLSGYSDYPLLYAHRGQQVTVAGRLGTDNITPYFWHGTLLVATSIRLLDGTDLLRSPVPVPKPGTAATRTFHVTALLSADLAIPWVYSVEGRPVPERRFLSCSSNGGGDVVNCFCAAGFHPTRASSLKRGVRSQAELLKDGTTAQFAVGDGENKLPIKLSVVCSR